MLIFVVAVFASAFLLFSVQPMMAKFLLPSFGGTAAVWSACLVFFQTLLLAGYAYAHLLRTKLSPLAQRWTHLGVLMVSLLFLPPVPSVHLAAGGGGAPVWELLRSLLASIGFPFFALSATAPLLMEWFRQSLPGRSPDRLYAFSNAGSLLALLAYPVLLEPAFPRSIQARLWAGGMVFFLIACALVAWRSKPAAGSFVIQNPDLDSKIKNQKSRVASSAQFSTRSPQLARLLWIALPACGSGLLLALTHQLSQDVTPTPLLWVAPMAVYLLTFILCFEGSRSYKRGLFIPACFIAFLLLAWLLSQGYLQGFWIQVGGYLAILFLACMVCHGELYRLRPEPERLTAYYLAISVGGAAGGAFVALLAPVTFKTLLETPLLAVAVVTLATSIIWRENPQWSFALPARHVALGGTILVALSLGYVMLDLRKESIHFARNFYGAYRVKEGPTLLLDGFDYPLVHGNARVLLSGQIYHGLQFLDSEAAKTPTAYFCEEAGLGLAFRELPTSTNRHIGVIGLGAGTIAAYGRAGDRIRFYELNPEVLRIAQNYFTYLSNCPAHVDVMLGDGRLSLDQELQNFDLFVLDAFAGDSIPMHLLTEEAMRIYKRHLKPDGVLAFHVSNSHLDLEPVVRALAARHGLTAVLVPPKLMDPREGKLPSVWMLLSANPSFLKQPAIAELLTASAPAAPERKPLLWTDDYSSILPILH